MSTEKIIANLLLGLPNNDILIMDIHKGKFSVQKQGVRDKYIVKSDERGFPFRDNSFGLVVLKENISNARQQIWPARGTFQNILNSLAPGGVLFFGFDNALSPSFLFRKNVLKASSHRNPPRNLGFFAKVKQHVFEVKCYRIHLWSYFSYLRLLRKIGFKDITVYCAPKGISYPCLIPFKRNVYNFFYQNLDPPRRFLKAKFITILSTFGINRYFCASYVLIGKKSENQITAKH